MQLKVQVTMGGVVMREVAGEISGKLSEREAQLRNVFREAEGMALEKSLRRDQPQTKRPRCCQRPMKKVRLLGRQLVTPVGVVRWKRRVYACPTCKRQVIPLDKLLGVPRGQLSPRLAKLSMDFVEVESYGQAVEKLRRHHGVSLPMRTLVNLAWQVGPVASAFEQAVVPKDWPTGPIERLYVGCDGVMTCSNQKGDDGRLLWREVKVGCCFWYDPSGRLHKRVLGRIESASVFGPRLHRWAQQCGLDSAKEVVFMGDGAEWIWNIAGAYFNDDRTTWVLDWYHLVEHLWEAARELWPDDSTHQTEQVSTWKATLRYQGGRSLWRVLGRVLKRYSEGSEKHQAVARLLGYLGPRLDQTDYPDYRARDMCIGSGAVESSVKQLVVQRAKGPGMHWTVPGLQAVISLRAISLNGDWDTFWDTEPQTAAA